MGFFSKFFQKPAPEQPRHSPETLQLIQDTTNQMWEMLGQTLTWYHEKSCACAFPRFHQYVAIDCVDYRGSFYMSETEGFISHVQPYFHIQPFDGMSDAYGAIYTCKKCGSIYHYGWSDFSISVSRSTLKIQELKTITIGAPQLQPIPFVVGPFGHKCPDRNLFVKTDVSAFTSYLRELA